MKVDCNWNGKQNFIANINGFKVHMDATKPFVDDKDPTPTQLALASLCGCTGMDIVGLLKRNKQNPQKFKIEADADIATDHPHELKDIKLKYKIDGTCDPTKVIEAVNLAQTRYPVVSSLVSEGTKIFYDVFLNGKHILPVKSELRNCDSEVYITRGMVS